MVGRIHFRMIYMYDIGIFIRGCLVKTTTTTKQSINRKAWSVNECVSYVHFVDSFKFHMNLLYRQK